MQEERGFRETGKPGDKHVIIDDLTSYDDEIGVAKDIKRGSSSDFGWLKNIFVALLLVGIVVGSFWISFLIGKRVLTPVKPLKSEKVIPIEERVMVIEEEVAEEKPIVMPEPKPEPKPAPESEPAPLVSPKPPEPQVSKYYKVHVGSFDNSSSANSYGSRLKSSGFPTYVKKLDSGIWTVQTGAFKLRSQAETLVSKLRAKGFESNIVYE